MGRLIVIEGVDGSGKATQTEALYNRLISEGKDVLKVSFPNYESVSSVFVKMYLAGEFGENAGEVNPKAASTLFALDRFVSYHKGWKADYNADRIIIADRYVTSNMVHQAAKIESEAEKEEFLGWLYNLEYNIYKLPVPDCVIFLDMSPEFSVKLTKDRLNKATGGGKKDIHESDLKHLNSSYKNACFIADKLGWRRVNCVKDGKVREVSDIADEVYGIVSEELEVGSL